MGKRNGVEKEVVEEKLHASSLLVKAAVVRAQKDFSKSKQIARKLNAKAISILNDADIEAEKVNLLIFLLSVSLS